MNWYIYFYHSFWLNETHSASSLRFQNDSEMSLLQMKCFGIVFIYYTKFKFHQVRWFSYGSSSSADNAASLTHNFILTLVNLINIYNTKSFYVINFHIFITMHLNSQNSYADLDIRQN